MPKFVVVRGRDAWVIEEAVIEADSAEQAEDLVSWHTEQRKLDWVKVGDVREFDDTEIMEGETHPYSVENEPLARETIYVTDKQRDQILAALRLWQDVVNDGGTYITQALLDIATNGDDHELLDDIAIDELCEAINS